MPTSTSFRVFLLRRPEYAITAGWGVVVLSLWSVSNARDVSVVLKYVDESNLKFLVARGGFKKKVNFGCWTGQLPLSLVLCVWDPEKRLIPCLWWSEAEPFGFVLQRNRKYLTVQEAFLFASLALCVSILAGQMFRSADHTSSTSVTS